MYFCSLIFKNQVLKKYLLFFSLIAGLILLSTNCANQGSPTGGPKDTIAPLIKKISPLNQSTNFKNNKITIKFDEFVELKDVANSLIVSPPVENKPEVATKGKGIVIKIKDTLLENTTYVLNFGDAIVDYTEGNPIHNYKYILSTGNYIDTLWFMGIINDAFTLIPSENVFIGLYKNLEDSIPYLEKPNFIAKSGEDGIFSISNLPGGIFRIFALSDNNSNLMYDNGEAIGFFDYFLKVSPSGFRLVDANQNFTEYRDNSGLIIPEYNITQNHVFLNDSLRYIDFVNIKLFTEDKEHQYLLETKREKENKIDLTFNKPHLQNITFHPLNFERDKEWFLFEKNLEMKTLSFWITDTSLTSLDTLNLAVTYFKTDSVYNYTEQTDTIVFRFIHKEAKEERKTLFNRNKEEEIEEVYLSFKYNLSGSGLDLGNNLKLSFDDPIEFIDKSKITLEKAIDDDTDKEEKFESVDFEIFMDSIGYLNYYIIRDWQQDDKYKISYQKGAFKNYQGFVNDSLVRQFNILNEDKYGRIILTFTGVNVPHQFLLLDEKEVIVREVPILGDTIISLDYLNPKKYIFKAFEDYNQNHKWDVGVYLEHKQAEKVKYYMPENEIEQISIKANWENEITWNLK